MGVLGGFVRYGSGRGDLVLDAFLGSGTTLIAAERTGRTCYGIELDPLYVDTIIRRWQAYAGEIARHAVSGQSFAALAKERGGQARPTPAPGCASQRGDKPDYDGLLELFPQSFHEPYYSSYIDEDFGAIGRACGLTHRRDVDAYVSKVMVFDKPVG